MGNIPESYNELIRLFLLHNEKVKEQYQPELSDFIDWLSEVAHDNYAEIPSNETLSGHAEILDW